MKSPEVQSRLHPQPPPILYHYTNQQGLLGIVQSRELWATHTQFLNDATEYKYALKIVLTELKRMSDAAEDESRKGYLTEIAKWIHGIESINVCVSSFSEVADSLSQWRAYGDSSSGFSIGISGEKVKAQAVAEAFYLVKCIYEPAEQLALVHALLEEVLEENLGRALKNPLEDLPPGGNLQAYLHRCAPIIKHPSFAEEREWRLISRPLSCKNDRYAFRSGRSMLVPYYRFPLQSSSVTFEIERIIVGPTPHPVESAQSVQSLLRRENLHLRESPQFADQVSASAAPYRSW